MNTVSRYCNNCRNCINVCPVNAITIKNYKKFQKAYIDKKKCINCNLCKIACPFEQDYKQKEIINKYIVRIKNENNIYKSSSGGFFGELSRELLKSKYIIYGAAFNEKFELHHVRVNKAKDLNKILKSKYVQSNLGNIFDQVQTDLNKKLNVLFSGTSCQIASLKKYLKKEYSNLYTIDLICHGTPSPEIWMDYVHNESKNVDSLLQDVDFRFYNKKDFSKNFLMKFKNKKIINEPLYANIYGKAFLNNIILNDSCHDCPFKNSRNQSDLTIGDAHGYTNEQFQSKLSLIIVNTKIGETLFKKIKEKIWIFNDFNIIDLIENNYPLLYPSLKHYNNEFMLNNSSINIISLLENSFGNLIEYSKKNVGILNFYYENYNYGANLVAYSLQKLVEKLGYNAYIINFNPFDNLNVINQFKTLEFVKFREKHLKLTPVYKNADELYILNKHLHKFIVGSDQVWRKDITQNNLYSYFLDFVMPHNQRISYGASFGNTELNLTDNEKEKCKNSLEKFSAISVREKDAVEVVENQFNTKAELVLDPTLMLSCKDYEKIANESWHHTKYVAYYCLFDQEKEFMNQINKLFKNKKKINIKLKEENIPLLNKKVLKYRFISDWINGIKNADFIITDSYHGMIFSILFKKEFLCLGKNSKAKSRFDTLCEVLGGNIESRIIGSLADVESIAGLKNIDYKTINKNLLKLQKKSLKFLETSLNNFDESKILKNSILELYNKQEIINKTKDSNFVNKEEIKVLKNNLKDIEEQLSLFINDNNCLKYRLNESEKELVNIMSSKSWKITKPLRFTSLKFKKLKSKSKKQ